MRFGGRACLRRLAGSSVALVAMLASITACSSESGTPDACPAGTCSSATGSGTTATGSGASGGGASGTATAGATTGPGAGGSGTGGAGGSGDCTKPDATTTGVPASASLTPHAGGLTVRRAGAIIEDLDIDGGIAIEANDVTIRRCRVRGNIAVGHYPDYGITGAVIEDSEIGPDSGDGGDFAGVGPFNYTLRRVDIHNFDAGAQALSNVLIEQSYIHHPWGPDTSGVGAYVPFGPDPVVLRCNNVDQSEAAPGSPAGGNAAYHGTDHQGPDPGVLVLDHNWFGGGSYTVYILDEWASVEVTNNVWDHTAAYGPIDYDATVDGSTPTPLVWTNNQFDDGQVIDSPGP